MLSKFLSCLVITYAVSFAHAAEACDAPFTDQYRDSLRIVDSLRADKSGQARLFAADGSEFTAGQAQWMRGQLRMVEDACGRGDQVHAAELLRQVQALLKSHRRVS
jgi:hypothetical protein